jgi:DNA invertase Pin-like site-specific DNA recombinase
MLRVIRYCRVSTTDQKENGDSLSTQDAKMAAYAGLYDLEIVETIIDGESGKSLNREGLQRALAMLKAGKADGLLICKLDRLTRSVADWQTLINDYFSERTGKQLFSVNDSIDTRTAAGRLVLNILVTIGQWEREAIGERTKEVLRHKIDNRERVGAVRYGFDLAADGVNLVENVAEQAVLALIHDLRTAGHTLRQIADELTARKILTKEGNNQWSFGSVRRILSRAA